MNLIIKIAAVEHLRFLYSLCHIPLTFKNLVQSFHKIHPGNKQLRLVCAILVATYAARTLQDRAAEICMLASVYLNKVCMADFNPTSSEPSDIILSIYYILLVAAKCFRQHIHMCTIRCQKNRGRFNELVDSS